VKPAPLVGLCSSYAEGRLVQAAVDSLLGACEHVYVFEGPAGEPIADDVLEQVPASDLAPYADHEHVTVHRNRWRTDARKRQAMLEWAKQDYPGPLWGVIVDADETLVNGEYLADWLAILDWQEQLDETGDTEYVGRPMRIVELDGSLRWVRGRLLRLDRIVEYRVSTSVFLTSQGLYTNAGNVPDSYADWATPRRGYIDGDQMVVRPPIPTEPFLVHRSMLRHPLRRDLRLHKQERDELRAAGMKVDE
jgi:hypothetical protein